MVEHVDDPGWDDGWITVADLDRAQLATHPWSLSGGGAVGLLNRVEAVSARLSQRAESIGITSFTLEDAVYVADQAAFSTRGIDEQIREMILGDGVRDWHSTGQPMAIFPYDREFRPIKVEDKRRLALWMWPYRTNLSNNILFGGQTKVQAGLLWTEYGRLTASKLRTPLSIVFAFVATHNHFVLDHGGKVFNRSAPVIKLQESATENDHLAVLAMLNSSTACFWLKQNNYAGGGDPVGADGARVSREVWSERYQFNSGTVEKLPIPAALPLSYGRELDRLGREIETHDPVTVFSSRTPTARELDVARSANERLRARMISVQDELDWECYRLYGLLEEDLTYSGDDLPGLALGERAFEIVLASCCAGG